VSDPLQHFLREYAKAQTTEAFDASRCVLATVDAQGQPAARYLLLKGCDERGFRLFTNFASRKALELDAHPQCALCFHWHTQGVQVRVEGKASRIPSDEAAEYFHSRPRGSQLGAWASRQSQTLDTEAEMIKAFAETEARFADQEVPLPDFWGGYRVAPTMIEFWWDRPNRMHVRERYRRVGDSWEMERLWP